MTSNCSHLKRINQLNDIKKTIDLELSTLECEHKHYHNERIKDGEYPDDIPIFTRSMEHVDNISRILKRDDKEA